MAILTVGKTGQQYSTISSAVTAARSGDTLQVQAGTYANDYAIINKNLTLNAVGGRVKVTSSGLIPNGKGIFVTDGTINITGFDFSGARVSSANGAGIRHQSGSLTVNNTGFFNNQNGILTNNTDRVTDSVTINRSEFAFNGTGTNGQTHQIYMGRMGTLTIDDSYFHDVTGVGHHVKSRADHTTITDTRLYDNNSQASYNVDIPNGGNARIERNVIQQGPNSQNFIIVSYGAEGQNNPGTTVVVNNNIVDNDRGTALFFRNYLARNANITNNDFYGLKSTQILSGMGTNTGSEYFTTEPTLNTSSPLTSSGTAQSTAESTSELTPRSTPESVDHEIMKPQLLTTFDPDGSGTEPEKQYSTTMGNISAIEWEFIDNYAKDQRNGLADPLTVSGTTITMSYVPDQASTADSAQLTSL